MCLYLLGSLFPIPHRYPRARRSLVFCDLSYKLARKRSALSRLFCRRHSGRSASERQSVAAARRGRGSVQKVTSALCPAFSIAHTGVSSTRSRRRAPTRALTRASVSAARRLSLDARVARPLDGCPDDGVDGVRDASRQRLAQNWARNGKRASRHPPRRVETRFSVAAQVAASSPASRCHP